MRSPNLALFGIATACWIAAGPGGETSRALLACAHQAMHHASGKHHPAPSDGPCFCDQMTGGMDLAVSSAVPTPPVAVPWVANPRRAVHDQALFPLPPSPAVSPASPPPIRLG